MWVEIWVNVGRLANNAGGSKRGNWVETAGTKAGASRTSTSGVGAFEADTKKISITKTRKKVVTGKNQLDRKIVTSRLDKDKNKSYLHNFSSVATIDGEGMAVLEKC